MSFNYGRLSLFWRVHKSELQLWERGPEWCTLLGGRPSSWRGSLKMNYCHGKGVQNGVLCWEVGPFLRGLVSTILYWLNLHTLSRSTISKMAQHNATKLSRSWKWSKSITQIILCFTALNSPQSLTIMSSVWPASDRKTTADSASKARADAKKALIFTYIRRKVSK